jgi:hypothetical protein
MLGERTSLNTTSNGRQKVEHAMRLRKTVGTSSKQDLCMAKQSLISNRSDDAETERKGSRTAGAAICHLVLLLLQALPKVMSPICCTTAHVSNVTGKRSYL